MAGFEIDRLFVSLGLDDKAFVKGFNKATANMKAQGEKLKATGRTLSRSITLPLLAMGVAAIKVGSDFEASLAKIENLVGVSSSQVAKWREEIIKLAPAVAIGPTALSDALFVVTSAGAPVEKALGIVEAAAKASAIGMGEASDIARAVTASMTAYKDAGLSAAIATDILAATVKAGNLEASQLAPSLGRVIPIASAMGVSFEEVGANVATFTRLGVSASEAVIGLRGTLASIQKPSSEAEKQALQLGTSFSEIRKSIREKGLAATLNGLITLTAGNETALSLLIPNVEALASVLGTAGSQGEEYSQILLDIQNSTGLVDKAFENVTDTSAFKFAAILVDLKNIGIRLEKVMRPALDKIVKVVRKAAKWFQNLDEKTVGIIAAVGGIIAILPILAIGIGTVMAVMSPWVILIGLVVAAVVGLVLAWDDIKAWIDRKLPAVGKAMSFVWDRIKETFSVAVAVFKSSFDFMVRGFKNFIKVFSGIWDVFAGVFTLDFARVWSGMKDIFSGVWDQIKNVFSLAINSILAIMPGFAKDWFGVTDDVKEGATNVTVAVKEMGESSQEAAQTITQSGGLTESLSELTKETEKVVLGTGKVNAVFREEIAELKKVTVAGLEARESKIDIFKSTEKLATEEEAWNALLIETQENLRTTTSVTKLATIEQTAFGAAVGSTNNFMSEYGVQIGFVSGLLGTDLTGAMNAFSTGSAPMMFDALGNLAGVDGIGANITGITSLTALIPGLNSALSSVATGGMESILGSMGSLSSLLPGIGIGLAALTVAMQVFGFDTQDVMNAAVGAVKGLGSAVKSVISSVGGFLGLGGGSSKEKRQQATSLLAGIAREKAAKGLSVQEIVNRLKREEAFTSGTLKSGDLFDIARKAFANKGRFKGDRRPGDVALGIDSNGNVIFGPPEDFGLNEDGTRATGLSGTGGVVTGGVVDKGFVVPGITQITLDPEIAKMIEALRRDFDLAGDLLSRAKKDLAQAISRGGDNRTIRIFEKALSQVQQLFDVKDFALSDFIDSIRGLPGFDAFAAALGDPLLFGDVGSMGGGDMTVDDPAGMGGRGAVTQTIIVELDGRVLTEAVLQELPEIARVSGVKGF